MGGGRAKRPKELGEGAQDKDREDDAPQDNTAPGVAAVAVGRTVPAAPDVVVFRKILFTAGHTMPHLHGLVLSLRGLVSNFYTTSVAIYVKC